MKPDNGQHHKTARQPMLRQHMGFIDWVIASSIFVLVLSIVTTIAVGLVTDQTASDLAAYQSLRTPEHVTGSLLPNDVDLHEQNIQD